MTGEGETGFTVLATLVKGATFTRCRPDGEHLRFRHGKPVAITAAVRDHLATVTELTTITDPDLGVSYRADPKFEFSEATE